MCYKDVEQAHTVHWQVGKMLSTWRITSRNVGGVLPWSSIDKGVFGRLQVYRVSVPLMQGNNVWHTLSMSDMASVHGTVRIHRPNLF